MKNIDVRATDEARSFLEDVASEMSRTFDISLDEAVGRINQTFRERQFLTDVEVNVLLHEGEDVWARHIYYGRESFWWLDEEAATPVPFGD